ncbi:acyl-homoserine-lactone synthase [Rhizobium helianthi]|uniref:Acyl-homoserine-lactone synthase n=1 Tax=Rhizobium helianthi TaxID=1132695 RepID=A0ABW4LZM6_9HYPH
MLTYIPGYIFEDHRLKKDVLKFRHRHFVERFGWEALRKPELLETDQFDTDEAIHLVLIKEGVILGYSRLLLTMRPHLLSDVYPEIAAGNPYPIGPAIYEWTRCVAEPDTKIAGISTSNILLTGVLEFCLVKGIEALIVETHPKLMNLLVSTGWDVEPFAAPCTYAESLVVPICAKPLHSALEIHHRLYGIEGSVLDLSAGDELIIDQTLAMVDVMCPGRIAWGTSHA